MSSKLEAGEAALNAVLGDYLDTRGNALATEMGLFHRGLPLAELPKGTSKLVVLVHGMACTESCWSFPEDPALDYGALLEREHGLTPLYVRYNTGLPIWNNGRKLALLLSSVVERSPVPVEDLTLIGHSMGGLVIRSACHEGKSSVWIDRVRRAFYLGTPHLGSPLEKAGRLATATMHAIPDPVVQLIGDVANLRSAAVKGLGNGDLLESKVPVPLDERIEHYLVAGSLPWAIAGHVLGDGLVRTESATGATREVVEGGSGAEPVGLFPGLHHMALSHHPSVYAWISERCGALSPTTPVEPTVGSGLRAKRVAAYLALLQEAVESGSSAVQGAHEALVARPYDVLEAIPPLQTATRAVRAVHFGVLRGTYAAVRWVNEAVGMVVRAEAPPPDRPEEP